MDSDSKDHADDPSKRPAPLWEGRSKAGKNLIVPKLNECPCHPNQKQEINLRLEIGVVCLNTILWMCWAFKEEETLRDNPRAIFKAES